MSNYVSRAATDITFICMCFTYNTYNTNASLYLGLQLPDLLLVDCFLFLSASLGPIRWTSTNGRNMPVVGQTNALAATTVVQKRERKRKKKTNQLFYQAFDWKKISTSGNTQSSPFIVHFHPVAAPLH